MGYSVLYLIIHSTSSTYTSIRIAFTCSKPKIDSHIYEVSRNVPSNITKNIFWKKFILSAVRKRIWFYNLWYCVDNNLCNLHIIYVFFSIEWLIHIILYSNSVQYMMMTCFLFNDIIMHSLWIHQKAISITISRYYIQNLITF